MVSPVSELHQPDQIRNKPYRVDNHDDAFDS